MSAGSGVRRPSNKSSKFSSSPFASNISSSSSDVESYWSTCCVPPADLSDLSCGNSNVQSRQWLEGGRCRISFLLTFDDELASKFGTLKAGFGLLCGGTARVGCGTGITLLNPGITINCSGLTKYFLGLISPLLLSRT